MGTIPLNYIIYCTEGIQLKFELNLFHGTQKQTKNV